MEDTKCRGLSGGCRTSWGLDLEALARGTIWVIEEGVDESDMGCSGKEGPSHNRSSSVDGSSEAPSSRLPFYLATREPTCSLFKFWELCLWVNLRYIVGLPRAFSDTGYRRGKDVRKQEAASGFCAQSPRCERIWELRQDSLPFVSGAFQSPQALALLAHGVHHVFGKAGTVLSSGHPWG